MSALPLPSCTRFLSLGSPRFTEARLSALARTEGLLFAWQMLLHQNGCAGAAHVNGDFAVGLQQPDGRTFLAVDRFSQQTLCYRVDAGQLRFAARADELSDAATPLEPQALLDYLYFHVIASPRTVYQGIHRLPPGHYALFENGQLTVAPYWRASFQEPARVSFADLKDEFRGLLHQAVRTQLDGSKAACFLSGGTDSSTVTGLVGLFGRRPVSSYSIGFDAQGYDEMAFARLAARHFQTQHHEYYVTPDDLVRSIGEVAAHFDQPFGNSSALPAYYCAKMARADGVSKLLAGDGGDELFGGNSRYAKSKLFDLYQHLPQGLRNDWLEPFLHSRPARALALTRKAASYVEQARRPMPDRLQLYNLLTRLGPREVLTPALLAQVNLRWPLQWQRAVWQNSSDWSPLHQELAFDWRFTLAECDLPKVRGATSLAGVGVGFPLLDDGLLAFAQRLPSAYQLKGLQLRWFFKEALRDFLPDAIIHKKKQGFGLPFGLWVNQHGPLKALASDSLRSLGARGVVRAEFVERLLNHHLAQHPGYFGEMVWILLMLEQWLRAHRPAFRVET